MTLHRRGGRRRLVLICALALTAASTAGALLPASWTDHASAAVLPIAVPDTYSMRHDRATTVPAPGVLANDLDLLGGTTAVKTADPTHGSVNLQPNGGFTYTPDAGYLGTDVFRYRPSGLLGVPTTVTITVTNARPVANNDTFNEVSRRLIHIPAPGVLVNDTDADGDALTAQLVDGSSGSGSVELESDGSFTFDSGGGEFVGTRTFTYRVSDGLATSTVRTVSIVVRAPSPPPTPTPTPPPTPAPTPTPTPVPTPRPTLPLPTLPLPTLPLPTLPLPTRPPPTVPPLPTATATATPTPVPGATIEPGVTPSPSPTGSTAPGPSLQPGATPTPTPPPGGGPSAPAATPGAGAGPAEPDGGFTVGQGGFAGFGPIDGLIDVEVVGFDGVIEWAVPALVLSVPGLLLLLAVIAQALGGLLWLPFVRRWLGGFGIRKRRSAERRLR